MSQYDWGTINPYVEDGVQLSVDLNSWRDAMYTQHRGAARPAYVVPGVTWISDAAGSSGWLQNFYTGPTKGDLPVFTIDTVAGTIALADAMRAVTRPSPTDNTKSVANCEWVQQAVAAAVNAAISTVLPVGTMVDVPGALSVAPSGWVLGINGTIGNGASGATIRANADCSNLYQHLWNGLADSEAPVTGGRGGNALADFNAGKPIAGLDFRGQVRASSDGGRGLLTQVSRVGQSIGVELVTLSLGQMPNHNHGVNDPGHTHQIPGTNLMWTNLGSNADLGGGGGVGIGQMVPNPTGISIQTAGSNQAHQNMQPTRVVTTLIKL